MNVVKILGAVPLFGELDPVELGALASVMVAQKLKRNDALFVEGKPPSGLFVILSGKVAVMKHREGGGDHICDLDGGECVGEVEIIDGSPCTASVVAYDDVEVVGISKQALESFLASQPVAAVKILRRMVSILSGRLRQINVNYSSLKAIAEGT